MAYENHVLIIGAFFIVVASAFLYSSLLKMDGNLRKAFMYLALATPFATGFFILMSAALLLRWDIDHPVWYGVSMGYSAAMIFFVLFAKTLSDITKRRSQ